MSADKSASKPFQAMADLIEHNKGRSFGGAFVVVDSDGNSVETLMMDGSQDLAQFWGLLSAKCKMKIDEIEAQRAQGNLGVFRR